MGNAAIGVLYSFDGSPAAGATVRFYASGADPRSATPAAIVTTGQNGQYAVSGLTGGAYNVLGLKGTARSYLDSVTVSGEDTSNLPADTLREVGSVCGAVKLVGDTTAGIYVLALGTGTFAAVDSAGRFCLSDMAPGTYHVRILTTLAGYGPRDTVLMVPRGAADTVGTIWINSSVIPVPVGVVTEYDTLMQVVRLSWRPCDPGLVSSYSVYRRNVDSNTVPLAIGQRSVADTVYMDSAVVQDETYEYTVVARSGVGVLSRPTDAAVVTARTAFHMAQTIVLRRTFANRPRCFAVDSAHRLWVPTGPGDGYEDAVVLFSDSGDSIGRLTASRLSSVAAVARDAAGYTYVLDQRADSVFSFDSAGLRHNAVPVLPSATKMTLSASGDLYITHYSTVIAHYNPASGLLLSTPYDADDHGALVEGSDGRLYDCHYPDTAISTFDERLGRGPSLRPRFGLTRLYQVQASDGGGHLYVFHRSELSGGPTVTAVFVCKLDGSVVARWGGTGGDEGVADIRIVGAQAFVLVNHVSTVEVRVYALPAELRR